MTENKIKAGDISLTYLQTGKSDGKPILFLHSLFMSSNDWNDILNSFSENYCVYALNLRGHSTSDWPGTYSFDVMAKDVLNFLDALKIDKVILIGHSLGGIASYFIAALHPERIAALVLEEAPPPKPVTKPFNFGSKPKGKLPYDWSAITGIVDLLNHADDGWWKLAERIEAPTLLISGGKSSHVPQIWNQELAALIPNSKLVEMKGGHFVHSKYPKEFVEQLNEFLFTLKFDPANR